ncbi:MAG: DDE-type integrase/transposase/recombinase [Firmicutes bacterium]|nr:DDE-type integrase/transposase/recombinase [Bacillota bacterium]
MDDEERRVEVALFRYGCIAELLQRKLPRGEQARILERLANQEWEAPGGEKVRLSVSTLKSWLARYRKGGFEALKPKPREDRGRPRALDPALIERAAQLKRELPARSVPQVIRMLEASGAAAKGSLSRATLHRHLRALGLTRRQPGSRQVYQRFEREEPGELWQIDQTDGIFLPDPRRPGKFRKTVLFVIIDDHSRYCPHAQFYPDGKMPRLEHCMRQALAKAGIPQAVYVDRAKIHVSRHFRAACAALGIRVILGRRRNPAGRGKLERFNRTVEEEVYPELRLLVAREEVKTEEQANPYFWAWLEEDYHRRPHSETGEPPRDRYFGKPPRLPDPVALANLFLSRVERTVRKDATIRIGGNRYQVDSELRDREKVEVRYARAHRPGDQRVHRPPPQGGGTHLAPLHAGGHRGNFSICPRHPQAGQPRVHQFPARRLHRAEGPCRPKAGITGDPGPERQLTILPAGCPLPWAAFFVARKGYLNPRQVGQNNVRRYMSTA